jgi:pimeloyl-ACP methyl ester carboxylesterase
MDSADTHQPHADLVADPARRAYLRDASAGAAIALAAGFGSAQAVAQPRRRTFVLVHGAWHGGWCWRKVTDLLESRGHKIYTPTLTGLADRSHLLSNSITLQTHIDDITNLFVWEDLQDVVLVAHSYGGWPVSGALEKVERRVSSVVFLDAFLPTNGQRVIDLNAPQFQQALLDAIARGEPGRPVPPAEQFKVVRASDAAWIQAKMTPQPTMVSTMPIVLTGARERVAKKTYIRAPRFANPRFDQYLGAARSNPTWHAVSLPEEIAGHDAMVDAPERIAELLLEAA